MVDPNNITCYQRSQEQLEEFLLFCVVVAGKNAQIQAIKLDNFLVEARSYFPHVKSPFQLLACLHVNSRLVYLLQKHKLGQYHRLSRCFCEIVQTFTHHINYRRVYSSGYVDLTTCSLEQLEKIFGIGPKTARLFLLHSRKNQRLIPLDTHILKWLHSNTHNLQLNVPKNTPSGNRYKKLEQLTLELFDEIFPAMSIAEIDLNIWKHYAQK